MQRREFIKSSIAFGMAGTGMELIHAGIKPAELYRISLAQWSLHRMLEEGELDPLAFATVTRQKFDLDAVEYVNQFYKGKAADQAYLKQLKQRADDSGVRSLLIMCDGEGRLGDPDDSMRRQAVENHYKWIEAAAFLGCHSIRVNAASEGSYDDQIALAADSLRQLCEYGDQEGINVIVENHGGLSSNGAWLTAVMRRVAHPRCGTLPDFGNFSINAWQTYDRYQGVKELMPFAKAVSAKSHDFDAQGNETNTDYFKMMRIVLEAGYRGYVGIEYEGDRLSEFDGIFATRDLLIRVREKLSKEFKVQ